MAEGEVAKGKAATQERVLAAATELFITRSYEGTAIADIAKRAGVSRSTVFWHFGDKRGLFREAFIRLLAPFRESLERDLVTRYLEKTRGNLSRTAKELGISRPALYDRMKKLGIRRP